MVTGEPPVPRRPGLPRGPLISVLGLSPGISWAAVSLKTAVGSGPPCWVSFPLPQASPSCPPPFFPHTPSHLAPCLSQPHLWPINYPLWPRTAEPTWYYLQEVGFPFLKGRESSVFTKHRSPDFPFLYRRAEFSLLKQTNQVEASP